MLLAASDDDLPDVDAAMLLLSATLYGDVCIVLLAASDDDLPDVHAAGRTLSAKRFTVHHVKHSRAQFVKRVPACQRTLGTQTLDRVWDVLTRYIPKEISSRKIKDGRSDLLHYVYSCLWRRQVTQLPLLHALGKLCRDC